MPTLQPDALRPAPLPPPRPLTVLSPCYIPSARCAPYPATPPEQVAHLAAYAGSVAAAIGALFLLSPPAAPLLPAVSAPRLPAGGGGGSHGARAAAADEEGGAAQGGAAQGDAAVQGGAPTDDAPAYLKVAGVARLKLIEEQKLLKRLAAGLLNTI